MTAPVRRLAGLVVAISVLVGAAGCNLQTTDALKGHLTLYATFDDAQHLVAGHAVRVGDVQVGSVTHVALAGYRARVTMSIADGHHIPVGTTAVLGITSLLGENYVQLTYPPSFDPVHGPFLASGAQITDTSVQPALEQVTAQAINLLGALSAGDLSKIVTAAAQGLGGRGAELHTLVGQLASVGQVYAGQSGQLATIVDGLGKLGASLGANAGQIGTLIANLAGATSTLATQRERIIGTVQALTGLAQALNDHVLVPHAAQLETLLAQLDPIVSIVAGDKTNLEDLITNVGSFVVDLHKNVDNGALLLYIWFSTLILPNGTRVPTQGGAQAVTSLLRPTP
jgi:phospholipid/cholesterol/gamma-HCH transport system substrate-binding protein